MELELLVAQLLGDKVTVVTVGADGTAFSGTPPAGVILSGAFNPLHEGHRHLLRAACSLSGLPGFFELAVVNADKGYLEPAEILRRIEQFRGQVAVALSREPLFTRKALLYPGSSFVVGYDTAIRLLAPRYYGGKQAMYTALATVRDHGCRFLVGGRLHQGRFHTLADLDLPDELADLFLAIPENLFRADVSSTELRRQMAGDS